MMWLNGEAASDSSFADGMEQDDIYEHLLYLRHSVKF